MLQDDHGQSWTAAAITPIDPPRRRAVFRVLMIVVALEPLVIFAVLLAVGVPWWVILGVAAVGAAVLAAVLWIIGAALWRPWARRYPPQPPRDGAVSQSWQSFGLGSLGRLNNCLTIVADDRHVHLLPFAPLRWVGCRPISLPLDRIGNVRRGFLPQLGVTAEIDGRVISGPAWALGLANAASEVDTTPARGRV